MRGPPDLLVVLTTQWRGQALGVAGDPNARTPALDSLAHGGVVFTRALTPHPFGPFARAAFLTGMPSPGNGLRDYYDPLPRNAPTLARSLAARGYETAFFGKWHLAPKDRQAPLVGEAHARQIVEPADRGGFEMWQGFEGGFQLNDPWLQGGDSDTPRRAVGYQSDVLAELAAEWLSRPRQRPRLCVLSLEPPHPPYSAPAAGIAPRDPDALVLPANVPLGGEAEHKARTELAGYYAHIEATDRALGRLLARPELADAVRVVTSVHGDMHGAHGLFRKGWPHEESLRVPLIVRLPDSFALGERSIATPVTLLDLHRWLTGWAEGRTGFDLPAFVRCSMPSVVALPHQCDCTWRAVIEGDWKYVENGDGRPWLLFNLREDPLELVNLAARPGAGGRIAALRGRLA